MKKNFRRISLTLLIENIGNFIHNHKFISWLSSKLNYYPGRLNSLINNTTKVFVPRNSAPNVVHNQVYSLWIKNSISSTDRKSDSDTIYVSKMKYLREQESTLELEDENISEFVKVKKNGNAKTYMTVQRLIYTEAIRKLHAKFLSFLTFFNILYNTYDRTRKRILPLRKMSKC